MLKVLCHVEKYPPIHNSGAETYLHSVNKYLVSQGHEVMVMLMDKPWNKDYDYDGVKCFVNRGHWGAAIVDSDVVITQLDATFDTSRMVKRKPILWICHSGFDFPTVRTNREINILYNGHKIVELAGYRNPYFVLPPPVDIDSFHVSEDPEQNEYITLVNMNHQKGGEFFWKLAEMMPDKKFLGVKGYGPQIAGNAPNVTVIENNPDIRSVYAKTRLLLIPSIYESYGMVGLEAMANGIPVLANDAQGTFGLKENLDYAGIFLDRNKPENWVDMIRKMDDKATYREASKKSRQRAEDQRPDNNLEDFEDHLHELAGKKKQSHIPKKEYDNGSKRRYK